MKTIRQNWLAAVILIALQPESRAIDSASIEFAQGNKTEMVRIGAQWLWQKKWWESQGMHLGGYWNATLARWRGTRFQNTPNSIQHITAIGFTPVLRYQRDTLKGPYVEAGIGVHYLSDLYDNNSRQLSTKFEFGDHLGIGYVFQNNLDFSLMFQHFSNGGIKHPNDGINFVIFRMQYRR